ncbi:hypothetical protein OIE66_33110 [Nonomuraea sp. NBC_01738]|uniref:hypothetical protein n=1 Tax=Nonomuraea sp. NBC_01738 TaxID=2976003 RepID=UPI002E14DCF2|nr:hypothetical protein OIE66_33110 [Nonomuraea sp. NBC_01738]
MKKIAVGIISALVGGAMLLSGGTASAHTRTSTVEIRDISPNPVVVKAGGETTAYFKVDASSDIDKVTLKAQPEGEYRALREKSVNASESWRFSITFNDGDAAGKWSAIAEAYNKDGKKVAEDKAYFSVDIEKGKAETRISRFTADPYKVRKGKSIYFSGRLQVDDEGWEGVRGERVNVYYRANGSSGWKWVASAKTKWGGKFSTKTRAWRSGTFKAVYNGNDELDGATSRADYVRVTRGWHH